MAEQARFLELSPDELRWRCDSEQLGFESTRDLRVNQEIIGQPRASEAIRVGLEIDGFGYNIFVTGLVGTGRHTTVKRLLRDVETVDRIPEDLCYVNNFKNPDHPRILVLAAGRGIALKKGMENLIESLRRDIAPVLESEAYEERKKKTEILSPLARDMISDIREKYDDPKVRSYLQEVETAILENLDKFHRRGEKRSEFAEIAGAVLPDPFFEFRVNVLVDNSETQGAPIVVENFPTYRNLFGALERELGPSGLWRTDFTKIKAGSLIRANGGYLIINARDALIEPGVWTTLKRILKHRSIEIQIYDPRYLAGGIALKPESIELKSKIIMIGDNRLYHLLHGLDEDFRKIFKVKADFDSVMDRMDENLKQYASFISKICLEESLHPFHKTGVAALLEYAVRLAGKQGKLSTRFHAISDIMREANYWAKKAGSAMVYEAHVDQAIEKRTYRVNMVEEKIREMIEDGTIMIDSEGKEIGQVNGLATYRLGDHQFARPSRITAKTAMGRSGVINIEREADLSGRTHNKGVLILAGYLRGKYAQDKPLTMSASVCFEQSYTGVDGDSAASTEVYAILSSLSGLPLRQDIAVTGSVNQKGEIQAIGGVNEKIEGFFDVCRVKGLNGMQGVLIPEQNVRDLMVRKDVVDAVEMRKFHIYPVKTIDAGIEILTGVNAGFPLKKGGYTAGSVNDLVDSRLMDLAEKMRDFGRPKRTKDKQETQEAKEENQEEEKGGN